MGNVNFKVKNGLDAEGVLSGNNISLNDTFPSAAPTLNLDFLNTSSLDSRISFSRASSGSYYDDDGLLKLASSNTPRFDYDSYTKQPKGLLIEESRTNLLNYSENFEKWYIYNTLAVQSTNSKLAPDGTYTADVGVTTAASSGSFYNDAGGISGTGTYTASIYIHNSSTSGSCNLTLWFLGNTSQGFNLYFNPQTGAWSSNTANTTYSITQLANGWYRYSLTATGTNALNTTCRLELYQIDGVSGHTIVVWGAQLEAGSFPTSYVPSNTTFTSRASTGTYVNSSGLIASANNDVARNTYNPANLGLSPKLLIENASTNLVTYSEQFDNAAWGKTNISVTANSVTSPDGATTADTLAISTTSSVEHYVEQILTTGANQTSTASWFVKYNTQRYVSIRAYSNPTVGNNAFVEFDIARGVVLNSGATAGTTQSYSITSYPNGWYRVTQTVTFASSTDTQRYARLAFSNGAGVTSYIGALTDNCYVWGGQLELGYPTSYIPTTTAAVTRAADISGSTTATRAAESVNITGSNFLNWYNESEGSIYSKFDTYNAAPTSYNRVYSINNGSYTNSIELVTTASGSPANWFNSTTTGGTVVQSTTSLSRGSVTANTSMENAFGFATNNSGSVFNGGTVDTDTSLPLPIVNQISFGNLSGISYLNGHIANFVYYPVRLSNTILQNLTK